MLNINNESTTLAPCETTVRRKVNFLIRAEEKASMASIVLSGVQAFYSFPISLCRLSIKRATSS